MKIFPIPLNNFENFLSLDLFPIVCFGCIQRILYLIQLFGSLLGEDFPIFLMSNIKSIFDSITSFVSGKNNHFTVFFKFISQAMVKIDFRGDELALLFVSFWIMWTFYFIANVIFFFKLKDSVYIKNRAPWLIFSSAFGQYLMMTAQTWKIALLPENFPNIVDHWFLWFMMPLHFLPYPIRTLRFLLVFLLAK